MIRPIDDQARWDELVLQSGGHPLQLWGWGEVKSRHGWRAVRLQLNETSWAGAQVLIRRLPPPFKALAYVPRGPVGEWGGEALNELSAYVKEQYGAVVLTVEPDQTEFPKAKGWRQSRNTILIPRTIIIDLSKSLDELQAGMTKKTRQYIRKSERDGVTVRQAGREDLAACLDLYRETAARAGFDLHGENYYTDIFELLNEHSPVFIAEKDKQPLAFLWLAASSKTAFELYGGMNDEGQRLRANYTLKWEAMRRMKEQGIRRYDVNGLLNDGISGFKTGFADYETQLAGTFDKPLSPLYVAWNKGLPAAKRAVRMIRRRL